MRPKQIIAGLLVLILIWLLSLISGPRIWP